MARKRVIDPKFWTDDKIIELNSDEKLLFLGLMSFSDDRGIHKNNSKVLKAEIFPAEDKITTELVNEYLINLLKRQLLLISEDKRLLKFDNWDVYQKIQHKTPSKYEDEDSNIIIQFTYYDDTNPIEVSPNIININNVNNIKEHSLKKNTPSIKPKAYKDRVTEWYRDFKGDKDKLKDFNETFPDIDIKQKLTECYTWLLKNVRKNYDKTFFNWCSNHSGRVNRDNGAMEFKMDAVGVSAIGYCSSCYRSEFYNPKTVKNDESKCCGSKLVPKIAEVNG